MGFLRRIFGLPTRDEKSKFEKNTESALLEDRYRRMGSLGTGHLELQLKDLLHVLTSAIQEIAVLKTMLKGKELWDDDLYKEHRIERMIHDHNAAGTVPREGHSIYPYTLDEEEFLRHVFHSSNDEVRKFQGEVEWVSSQAI